MTKKIVPAVFILLVVAAAAAFADHHTPEESGIPANTVNFSLTARSALLINAGLFDPLVEIRGSFDGPDFSSPSAALTLGSYLRPHKNLKIGLFYRLQQGVRHDDDWVWEDGMWTWAENLGRFEHLLIADVSPRFQLSFLPGENWVFMLKARYLFNTFNLHHSLYFRPGLSYFVLRERQPLVNLSLNYGFYIPLNFSDVVIYEHEPYFTALFHLGDVFKLEGRVSFRTVRWTTSADSRERGEEDYILTDRIFSIG